MINEKKTYQKAVAEVVYFDNSDVITTSGGGGSVNCNISVFGVGCANGW